MVVEHLFQKVNAVILGLLFVLCIPLHALNLEADLHMSMSGHAHHTSEKFDSSPVFAHIHKMGEVAYVTYLILFVVAVCFVLWVVEIEQPLVSVRKNVTPRAFRPPALMLWLSIHIASPPLVG